MNRTDGYHGGRGGHAPDDLREAMLENLKHRADEYAFVNGTTKEVTWLLGQLCNCSDALPQEARAMLDQHFGLDRTPMLKTFGSAARLNRACACLGANDGKPTRTCSTCGGSGKDNF